MIANIIGLGFISGEMSGCCSYKIKVFLHLCRR